MDSEHQHHQTPTKILTQQTQNQYQQSPVIKFLSQKHNSRLIVTTTTTPQGKFLRSSPKGTSGSIKKPNGTSNATNTAAAFHILPVMNTPPSRSKQLTKILNPFEAALTDRLHLPLICSPSLFQRPVTPQHSSTQFEWTIEEVSSLGPANVEPHETQFLGESYDSDVEAKVQAAISSYFKEQQIVPSPKNCPLRNQRVILIPEASYSESSSLQHDVKPAKRIRDVYTQTILTLPPILPIELENALKPYFQYTQPQQQSPLNQSINMNCDNKFNDMSIDYEARDASLRRKLFGVPTNCDDTIDVTADDDNDDIYDCNEFSPPPKTPEMLNELKNSPKFVLSRNSDASMEKNSFGSLSPISKFTESSGPSSTKCLVVSKNNFSDFLLIENIEPIKSSSPSSSSTNKIIENCSQPFLYNQHDNHIENSIKSTSEKFINNNVVKHSSNSSPNISIMSVDSFDGHANVKTQKSGNEYFIKLRTTPPRCQLNCENSNKSKSLSEIDILNESEDFDAADDDDDMQVSQLSAKSISSTSSSNITTPRRRQRKSANRKNLSQSFSCHFSDSDDTDNNHSSDINPVIVPTKSLLAKRKSSSSKNENYQTVSVNQNVNVHNNLNVLSDNTTHVNFYRTDSGFNEMSSVNQPDESKSSDFMKIYHQPNNVINHSEENHYNKQCGYVKNQEDFNNVDISMTDADNNMICSTPSRH